MKRVFCIIAAFCLFVSATGCAAAAVKDVSLSPVRIGSSDVHAELATAYTFQTAFSSADAVARVKVGNWLAEDADLRTTYYEATVLQCFKGNLPTEFTLLQDGCSTGTLKGYPLFTNGNEILVFLNEATAMSYSAPYWIIGSFTTVMDVSYDASSARYYADRYGLLGESVDISENYALQSDVFSEVYSAAVANDAIVADMQYSYPYIFSESDLIELMEAR